MAKTIETEKRGWVERHKYPGLFIYLITPYLVVQGLRLIIDASFREAITKAIHAIGL